MWQTSWKGRYIRDGKVRFKQAGGRLQVAAPYHADFPAEAKRIGGRWRYRSRLWTFPLEGAEQVKAAVLKVYGPEAIAE